MYIKLLFDKQGSYRFGYFNENEAIGILGLFLTSDVGCDGAAFVDWFYDENSMIVSANLTHLYKGKDYIIITDRYIELGYPVELKISKEQFIKVVDIWFNKICKEKPKEVTITEKDGEFSIETKN
jgi:hypothetical protein